MEIKVSSSSHPNLSDAMAQVCLSMQDRPGQLILAFCSSLYDVDEFRKGLSEKFPLSIIAGSTTCLGVMTNKGVSIENGIGLGLMTFSAEGAQYSVGLSQEKDAYKSGSDACLKMTKSSGRLGELPDFLLVFGPPGNEEKNLAGIRDYFGSSMPVCGGSAADNSLEGGWWIFDRKQIDKVGLLVVGFFLDDSKGLFSSFHCGYFPTEHEGIVTRSEGRIIHEIDGKPAVEVYNKWTGGALHSSIESGETVILGPTSLFPLARERGAINSVPLYLLSHPHQIINKKSISLFTEVNNDEQLVLMNGKIPDIEQRAANVAKSIISREGLTLPEISGAFVVFCAGCMLTLKAMGNLDHVVKELNQVLPGIPFLGIYSYGEQGCLLENQALHGNLMISVTIFKR